jgi:hypothetical protein
MYLLSINKVSNDSAYILNDINSIWHFRLGHVGSNAMNRMISHNMIPKSSSILTTNTCECCAQSKIVKLPFKSVCRTSSLLELIHTDLCDNKDYLTRGGKRYFITFIDDFSKFTYIFLLRSKDEAFEKFKIFNAEVENLTNRNIRRLRCGQKKIYIYLLTTLPNLPSKK